MRMTLRMAALLVLLGVVGEWKLQGRYGWWTHTQEIQVGTEPVTGMETRQLVNKFSPGYDFLAGGVVVAMVLAGTSFIFRKKTPTGQTVN